MSKAVLNLVFDNFEENGKPIPNGLSISKLGARNSDWNWITYDPKLNQKFYKVNEVTTDVNFFYVVSYNTNQLKDILDDTFIVSNEAIECCKNKNLKILFVNFHEVNDDEFYVLKRIVKYISDLGLDDSNFYYINNNSKLNTYKKTLNSKIHTYTSVALFEMLAKKVNRNESIFKEDKEFLFSCHNRATRKHRIETLCFLKKYNILEDTDWSFIDTHQDTIQQIQLGEITGYFTFVADEIDFFKKIGLKYSKYEVDKLNLLQLDGGHITNVVTPECYTNCYINIITETNFYIPEIHISEKSYRPFYYMQLPIFLATDRHVENLRKKFGFDMFDDLIDHSYDLVRNNQKRMKMVFEEIKRLNDNKDLVIEFYKKNKHRFEKNLELFQKAYNKEETINFFKTLSNKNINTLDKIDTLIEKINILDDMSNINLNSNTLDNMDDMDLNYKGDGFKIYHDIIVPNKCGTRYLREYILLNTGDDYNNPIDIKDIWDFPNLNWIVIRHPEEYLKSALKTDLISVWNNTPKLNELDLINRYVNDGTNHYFNNLYKTLYSYSLDNKNKKFVFLKDLSDFSLFKFANKKNYSYDSTKYNMTGRYYMDIETIIDYVKEFYPSQWDTIQINLKKEMFFYNKIIENCIFFNKISCPPIVVDEITPEIIDNNEGIVKEVIEKNSWLKKIV